MQNRHQLNSTACPYCGGFLSIYCSIIECLNDDCGFIWVLDIEETGK